MSEQVEKTPSEMKSRKPTRDDLALKSQQAMSELLEKLNLKPDRNELGVLYNFGKSNFEIVGKMFDNNLNKALGISRKNRKSLSDAQVVAGIEMIGKTSEKTMGEIVAKNGHDFAFRLPDSLRRDIGQTRASQSRALEHSQGQEQSI